MKHKRYIIICFWIFCATLGANAQNIIKGVVKDAGSERPVEVANVVALNGQKIVDFVSTNKNGEFEFSFKNNPDSLTLYVSSLGYEHHKRTIGKQRYFSILLKPQSVNLKEVVIRPGRVWGRNDTIKYDASQFLRAGDKTVEDLFKRLPGIDVDDNGNIRFKGKDVGKVYVEGLDLLGERYKTISKNLSAQSVKGVEVLDNHQRIKSLAGKIRSEVPDINLRLKDDFKDKWNFNTKTATGFSAEQFLYELETSAIQIAKKSQSLYNVKMSNTGNGITKEADEGYDEQMFSSPEYRLLSTNTLSAPLKEHRRLFDNALLATANRLHKTGEDRQIKFNAFYTHDDIRQYQNETTTYLHPQDTFRIDENMYSRSRVDKLNVSADYEDNNAVYFLRNRFKASLGQESELTDISGTNALWQQKTAHYWMLRNNLVANRTLKSGNIVRAQSVVSYWANRESLTFRDERFPYQGQGLYATAQGSMRIGKTKIAQEYTLGAKVDLNPYQKNTSMWLYPSYEYPLGDFRLTASVPTHLTYLFDKRQWMLLPSLNTGIEYKANYAWTFYGYANYAKNLGEILSFHSQPYWVNYRTQIVNEEGTPFSVRQYYSLRSEYKNTLKEFFITANVQYSKTQSNNTSERVVDNQRLKIVRHYTPHNELFISLNSVVSKGFYDLHTKMSMAADWSNFLSAQLHDGGLLPYSFQSFTLTPKLTIAPTQHIDISYNADIQRISSSFGDNSVHPLWNFSNTLELSYTKNRFEANIALEYYRNQLESEQYVKLFFADFNVQYKLKKAYLTFQVNNIFNQKQYQYTLYNPLSIYISRFLLRPREVILSAQFRF